MPAHIRLVTGGRKKIFQAFGKAIFLSSLAKSAARFWNRFYGRPLSTRWSCLRSPRMRGGHLSPSTPHPQKRKYVKTRIALKLIRYAEVIMSSFCFILMHKPSRSPLNCVEWCGRGKHNVLFFNPEIFLPQWYQQGLYRYEALVRPWFLYVHHCLRVWLHECTNAAVLRISRYVLVAWMNVSVYLNRLRVLLGRHWCDRWFRYFLNRKRPCNRMLWSLQALLVWRDLS